MTLGEMLTYAELKGMLVYKAVIDLQEPTITRVRVQHEEYIATILYSIIDDHPRFIDASLFVTDEFGTSIQSNVSFHDIKLALFDSV